jgi:hypothetical protein
MATANNQVYKGTRTIKKGDYIIPETYYRISS